MTSSPFPCVRVPRAMPVAVLGLLAAAALPAAAQEAAAPDGPFWHVSTETRAAHAFDYFNTRKTVAFERRKMVRQVFLVCRQDTHAVVSGRCKCIVAAGFLRQTPQHQRRVQRDRVERIGGHAHILAFSILRGDDGDACRELRKCLTKHVRI